MKAEINASDEKEEYIYFGQAWHTYSIKTEREVDIRKACRQLIDSKIFQVAFINDGSLMYLDRGEVRESRLEITANPSKTGIKISGHDNFIKSAPSNSALLSFRCALDLQLSNLKIFNEGFDFPPISARVYMKLIHVKCKGEKEYRIYLPYITIYPDGIMHLTLADIIGFSELSTEKVIRLEVNRSSLNVESVLGCEELLAAIIQSQEPNGVFKNKLSKEYCEDISALVEGGRQEVEAIEELECVTELVHTDQITLSDICRNLIGLTLKIISERKGLIAQILDKKSEYKAKGLWMAKPSIFIERHTNQQENATENRREHENFINSVMARLYQKEGAWGRNNECIDHRLLDDFNHFNEDHISLLLLSKKVTLFLDGQEDYTFNNVISDSQALNEAIQYIRMFYQRAHDAIDQCKTEIDIAKACLEISRFESSLIATRRSGEIAKLVDSILESPNNRSARSMLNSKIDVTRKSLELEEKVRAETYNKRLTIFFGIIASATLSPELIQPVGYLMNLWGTENQNAVKVVGTIVSFIAVYALIKIIGRGSASRKN